MNTKNRAAKTISYGLFAAYLASACMHNTNQNTDPVLAPLENVRAYRTTDIIQRRLRDDTLALKEEITSSADLAKYKRDVEGLIRIRERERDSVNAVIDGAISKAKACTLRGDSDCLSKLDGPLQIRLNGIMNKADDTVQKSFKLP
jgi:hypothetical protein